MTNEQYMIIQRNYVIYLKVEKQMPPSGFTKSSIMQMVASIIIKQDLLQKAVPKKMGWTMKNPFPPLQG